MNTLRRARHLSCLLLAWFGLWVGVAAAAPALAPQALEVICTSAGATKLVDGGPGDAPAVHGHQHDCGFCVVLGVPPAPASFQPAQFARQEPAPAARATVVVARSAARLTARAPPLL